MYKLLGFVLLFVWRGLYIFITIVLVSEPKGLCASFIVRVSISLIRQFIVYYNFIFGIIYRASLLYRHNFLDSHYNPVS